MTVFFLFIKKKRKAINELSRQLESIYIIKQYIINIIFRLLWIWTRNHKKKIPGDYGANNGCKTMQAKLGNKIAKNLIEMVNYEKN